MSHYLLGYDVGSSSVKVALIDVATGMLAGGAHSPSLEMAIHSPRAGWAEQDPSEWWRHAVIATRKALSESNILPGSIQAIGISYQMHGLVLVDKEQNALRPSIIWCDSRAVEIGERANRELGESFCQYHFLNSPGNFTASKLEWVRDNEPQIYERIHKVLLPGDYLAMRMSGK